MKYSAFGPEVGSRGGLLERTGFRAAAAVVAGSLLVASAGVAHADTVRNTLDSVADVTAEIMPLNVGVAGTTTLEVKPETGREVDPVNGCNVKNDASLTLDLFSSDPTVATVSPSVVQIRDCGADGAQTLTITPLREGSTTVSATVSSSNTAPGNFNLAPATFTVNVSAPTPSNAVPVLTLTGATTGAVYNKGEVPATTCNVVDAEDGPASFTAALSSVTGPYASDNLGEQTATCEHTDTGGSYVRSSVKYSIIDPSEPLITYTLDPVSPDGLNQWYVSPVKLTWQVSDPESPLSLHKSDCADLTITADQVATSYSCSAESAGGPAEQTITLKKDGTVPAVDLDGAATKSPNAHGWYNTDVLAKFIASDATSGLDSPVTTDEVLSGGEGNNVSVQSKVFGDMAGNTSSGTAHFNIDKTAPVVTYDAATTIAANGKNGWYITDVLAKFTGRDALSGLLTAPAQETLAVGDGEAVTVTSPVYEDKAGNTSTASATFKIDKTKPVVTLEPDISGSYYFGSVPAAPVCEASDATSGLLKACEVSGYSTAVGTHTVVAKAEDIAGNPHSVSQTYTVMPWTTKGFYQPIDMNNVFNTVKGGSTVPAKFEVFAGTTELTDPQQMKFTHRGIACPTAATTDAIEVTVPASTAVRYDATAGQFIYNWKTPVGAGKCYELTMTAADGTAIKANFMMK